MKYLVFIVISLPWLASGQAIPYGTIWDYYDLGNAPPPDSAGLTWKAVAYDDSSWESGAAELGYDDGDESTVIDSNTLTAYFRYAWNDPSAADHDYIRIFLRYDDGGVIYVNGIEVRRVNMPAGTVTYNTFASANSNDNAVSQFVLENPLVNGMNHIAVEIHQRNATSSDMSFDFKLEYVDATGDPIFGFESDWNYYDLAQLPPNDGNGNSWKATNFNDNLWDTDSAQLGYGDGDESTVINSATETAYFRKDFNSGMLEALSVTLLYDDGAVIYVDGTEILRVNMPAGVVQYSTVASGSSGDNALYTAIVPVSLSAGTHVVAVEVHQTSTTSSDLSFDLALAGLETIPPQVVRGPYLQKGSDDRMTIKWRTNLPTPSRIRYGTVPGLLPYVKQDTTLRTEHTIEVTGLMSDTKYYYTIEVDSRFLLPLSEELYFKTSPEPGAITTLKAWILGDCGTGNGNARAVRDAYYNFIGESHTDLILLLGDNAYNNGTDTEYQTALFQSMYEEKLKQSQLWACLGNHDGNSANSNTQSGPYYDIFSFPKNGECGGEPSGTEAYYSFDYGNVHFIILDSHESDRSVGGPMYDWCEFDIQNTTAKWIVGIWHHPAYSKGSHNSDTETALIQMRTNFVPMLEENGIDAILSGHSHSYERSFYINGHHGLSTTFDSLIHPVGENGYGDGRLDGDGAYHRMLSGPEAEEGMVYVTAGSSGKISGGSLNHPVMFYSVMALGSCYLEITNNELSLSFIRSNGIVDDHFTIRKADETCTPGMACNDGNACTVNDTFTDDCFCEGTYETSKMVTSGADSGPGTLRDLVQAACEGDTIVFDPSILSPITLQSQIIIDKDLTIIGHNQMTVLSGNQQHRIFLLETGNTLRLQHLRLADGMAVMDGGAMLVQGVLEIDEVEFVNNFQDGMPRAITNQGLVRVKEGVSSME